MRDPILEEIWRVREELVKPAELFQVRELLDARALLEADSFNRLSRLTNRYETAEEQILQILCFLALRKNTWPPGPVASLAFITRSTPGSYGIRPTGPTWPC